MSGVNTITVRVPLTVRHRPGRKTIVTPGGIAPMTTRSDPALVKALGRAFRWRRMLETGRYASVSDIARVEKIDRTYVGTSFGRRCWRRSSSRRSWMTGSRSR